MTNSLCDTAETEAPPAAIAALRVLLGTESRFPQPLTVGVPWPRGALRTAEVTLTDDAGDALPRQTEVLARWPDGSIKWLLVDTVVSGRGAHEHAWQLCPGELECSHGSAAMAILPRIEHEAGAYVVDTGAARFRIDRRRLMPFELIGLAGKRVEPVSGRVDLRRPNGKLSQAIIERSEIEAHGAVRTTLLFEGGFRGARGLRFRCRICFFTGTGLVRVRLTLHNTNRARHRGGLWDLGDPGSILFKDLSLNVKASQTAARTAYSAEPGDETSESPAGVEIYQDSSGGENWQSRNHVNREGRVPCRFRGYRVRCGKEETKGQRASPIVAVTRQDLQVTAAVPEFWQQFPKLLAAERGELRVGLFPAEWDDLHELQGGEQKTHTVWLHFGQPTADPVEPLAWVHSPAAAMPDPQWTADTRAVTPFLPAGDDLEPRWRALLQEAIDCDRGLARRREIIDEYGWRHYGEIYADHENTNYQGPPPVVSHYNNQYDVVLGTLLQWLRTGDRRWLDLADPLARHVIDIDVYHTLRDRAAYSGGLFWHTDHYLDAATSTHRSFSRHNRPPAAHYGGGPTCEHIYATGLLLYHYLTGDPNGRETVLELAHWIMRMDDGRNNVFGLIDDGESGIASYTVTLNSQIPGRGAGNSVNTLLDAWLLTRDRRFLQYAERLIRRVVDSPRDRDDLLENIESRWSYIVFLQAISRYLGIKTELDEFDPGYAHARNTLIDYGQWMASHERPYFDRREQLRFPTEAWAAQEVKKANTLLLAASEVSFADRPAMVRRARTLIERAWSDLESFPNRCSARNLGILMVEGVRQGQLLHEVGARAPTPALEIPVPTPGSFTQQRDRVARQLRTARGRIAAIRRIFTFNFWRVLFILVTRRWQAAPAERVVRAPMLKAGKRRRLKQAVLYASRAAGLFYLARRLTGSKLRILCYHGFALGDETGFRPGLFIEPTTLQRRIRYLQRRRVPVLKLDDAVRKLDQHALPPTATVITIDDGFFSTRQVLLSHFASAGMPATVYVTSYYADKQSPVFRLAVQYMFWKTRATRLDLNELTPELGGPKLDGVVALDDRAAADRALNKVMDYGERSLDEPGRTRCLRRLGQLLGVAYGELVSSRRLSLMTAEEIRSVAASGFDIQLHTHRHRFPVDEEVAAQEVRDNRRWLENTLGTRLNHFCYPSGLWSPEHFALLAAEGVQSAVTCEPGLNDARTNRLALYRFLDGENIAQIEFEAEVSGFLEILRKVRGRMARGRRE